MKFTINIPLDRIPPKTRAMLLEVQRIYDFADLADVFRWLFEPELTETVTAEVERLIRLARECEALHLPDTADSES